MVVHLLRIKGTQDLGPEVEHLVQAVAVGIQVGVEIMESNTIAIAETIEIIRNIKTTEIRIRVTASQIRNIQVIIQR